MLLFFITDACHNDMLPPVVLLLCIKHRIFFSGAEKVLTDWKSKVWILCSNLIKIYCTWSGKEAYRTEAKAVLVLCPTATLRETLNVG